MKLSYVYLILLAMILSACRSPEITPPTSSEPFSSSSIPTSTIPTSGIFTQIPASLDTPVIIKETPTFALRTPSPTHTSIILPTNQTISSPLSLLGNLIFINDSGLVQWNPIDNRYKGIIASGSWAWHGGIQALSSSTNGQKVGIYWRKTVEENEVTFLDLSSGTKKSLITHPSLFYYRNISISPNGSWLAYIELCSSPASSSNSNFNLISYRYRPAMGGCGGGMIYAIGTEASDKPGEVGYCREVRTDEEWRECMGYLWSPDSQSISWSDAEGVWITKIGQEPRLLVPFTIGVSPYQTASTVNLREWSPSGKYILAGIGHHGGWNWGIIDTISGQVFEFPNWIVGSTWGPSATWLADDRLFAVLPGNLQNETSPYGQIWGINSINNTFVLENEFQINVSPENYPTAPVQLSKNLFGFVILNIDELNQKDRGIYFVQSADWTPQKMNSLPANVQISGYEPTTLDRFYFPVQIYWSPQGDYVIYEDDYLETRLLIPTDYSASIDLADFFGDWSCCYSWLK